MSENLSIEDAEGRLQRAEERLERATVSKNEVLIEAYSKMVAKAADALSDAIAAQAPVAKKAAPLPAAAAASTAAQPPPKQSHAVASFFGDKEDTDGDESENEKKNKKKKSTTNTKVKERSPSLEGSCCSSIDDLVKLRDGEGKEKKSSNKKEASKKTDDEKPKASSVGNGDALFWDDDLLSADDWRVCIEKNENEESISNDVEREMFLPAEAVPLRLQLFAVISRLLAGEDEKTRRGHWTLGTLRSKLREVFAPAWLPETLFDTAFDFALDPVHGYLIVDGLEEDDTSQVDFRSGYSGERSRLLLAVLGCFAMHPEQSAELRTSDVLNYFSRTNPKVTVSNRDALFQSLLSGEVLIIVTIGSGSSGQYYRLQNAYNFFKFAHSRSTPKYSSGGGQQQEQKKQKSAAAGSTTRSTAAGRQQQSDENAEAPRRRRARSSESPARASSGKVLVPLDLQTIVHCPVDDPVLLPVAPLRIQLYRVIRYLYEWVVVRFRYSELKYVLSHYYFPTVSGAALDAALEFAMSKTHGYIFALKCQDETHCLLQKELSGQVMSFQLEVLSVYTAYRTQEVKSLHLKNFLFFKRLTNLSPRSRELMEWAEDQGLIQFDAGKFILVDPAYYITHPADCIHVTLPLWGTNALKRGDALDILTKTVPRDSIPRDETELPRLLATDEKVSDIFFKHLLIYEFIPHDSMQQGTLLKRLIRDPATRGGGAPPRPAGGGGEGGEGIAPIDRKRAREQRERESIGLSSRHTTWGNERPSHSSSFGGDSSSSTRGPLPPCVAAEYERQLRHSFHPHSSDDDMFGPIPESYEERMAFVRVELLRLMKACYTTLMPESKLQSRLYVYSRPSHYQKRHFAWADDRTLKEQAIQDLPKVYPNEFRLVNVMTSSKGSVPCFQLLDPSALAKVENVKKDVNFHYRSSAMEFARMFSASPDEYHDGYYIPSPDKIGGSNKNEQGGRGGGATTVVGGGRSGYEAAQETNAFVEDIAPAGKNDEHHHPQPQIVAPPPQDEEEDAEALADDLHKGKHQRLEDL